MQAAAFVAKQARQMRVDSCLRVIQDVSARLSREGINRRVVEQLERLDQLLSLIDYSCVSESDLARIESSTNQLMGELALLFSHRGLGDLYKETRH